LAGWDHNPKHSPNLLHLSEYDVTDAYLLAGIYINGYFSFRVSTDKRCLGLFCTASGPGKPFSLHQNSAFSKHTQQAARAGQRLGKFIRPQARDRGPHLLDPFVVDLNIFRTKTDTPENACCEHHMNKDFNSLQNQNMFRSMQNRNIQAKILKISKSPPL
jgi:hypothetical protein